MHKTQKANYVWIQPPHNSWRTMDFQPQNKRNSSKFHTVYFSPSWKTNKTFFPRLNPSKEFLFYFWHAAFLVVSVSFPKVRSTYPRFNSMEARLHTTAFTWSAVMSLTGVKRGMMSPLTNNNHPALPLSSLSSGCQATPQLSPLRAFPSRPLPFCKPFAFPCSCNGSSRHNRPSILKRIHD